MSSTDASALVDSDEDEHSVAAFSPKNMRTISVAEGGSKRGGSSKQSGASNLSLGNSRRLMRGETTFQISDIVAGANHVPVYRFMACVESPRAHRIPCSCRVRLRSSHSLHLKRTLSRTPCSRFPWIVFGSNLYAAVYLQLS